MASLTLIRNDLGVAGTLRRRTGDDAPAYARALAAELRKEVSGKVRFHSRARALYSTDGSNYRQVPIGVVVPKSAEDIIRAIAICRRCGAPVLAAAAARASRANTVTCRRVRLLQVFQQDSLSIRRRNRPAYSRVRRGARAHVRSGSRHTQSQHAGGHDRQ